MTSAHPELAALVEVTSYLRGADYYRRGLATVTSHDLTDGVVVGQVRGSAGHTYATSVEYHRTRNGSVDQLFGDCSCPVGVDCKHSVALLLTALTPAEGFGAAAAFRAQPQWQRKLDTALTGAGDQGHEQLALGFEYEPDRPSHWGPQAPRVQVRPLRRGKRGWIKIPGRWSALASSPNAGAIDPDHLEIMADLALVCLPGGGEYGGRGDRADLRLVGSITFWDVLNRAVAAGIELVTVTSPSRPVIYAERRAVAELDLGARGEGDLDLTAGLLTDGEFRPIGASALIGSPAHGVVIPDSDGALTVQRLTDRAGALWTRLATEGGVSVPSTDADEFTDRYLPRVSAAARIRATGSAAELTRVSRPELVLTVRLPGAHTATVDWSFRYRTSAGSREIPVDRRTGGTVLRDRSVEEELLAAVAPVLEATQWPGTEATLVSGMATVRLLTEVIPAVEAVDGVLVELTGDRVEYREVADGPQITVGSAEGSSTDWFDLSVTVTLGEVEVPFDQLFRALAAGEDALFLPDGTWCSLDTPELQRLRGLIEEAKSLQDKGSAGLKVSRFQLSWFEELQELGVLTGQAKDWAERLGALRHADLDPAPIPDGLQAQLRPYQLDGYRWLDLLRRNGLGGILADDMGLGKTLQTLTMILAARRAEPDLGPFLVIAPTSVVGNWAAEAARFTPDLSVAVVSETAVRRGQSLSELAAGRDILITSYTLFRLEYEEYAEIGVAGLILDEAQAVKNHQSKAFGFVKRMPAPVKIAITGTPMENNLMELWSLFSVVAPGLLGNPARFTEFYRNPIEKDSDREALVRLRTRIAPLMVRRTKELVARDLPAKQEQVLELELEPAHRKVYSKHLQRERQKVLRLIEDMDGNRFEILRSLTLLRQLAIDPQLIEPEHPDVPSTKLNVLLDLLTEIADEGHRVLVFSQFTRFLGRIRTELDARGIGYAYLDGATRDRSGVVNEFKTGTAPVFLISLKAGGVGLNLAEADYCVLMDPWWNPAAEAQAVDRAHRIGQTRPVMVYRLVAKDTIEEKVMALKDAKAALVQGVMSDEGITSTALTAADIRSLLD